MSTSEKQAVASECQVQSEHGSASTSSSVYEVTFGHKVDADEALKAIIDREGEPIVLDEATNRRILRKIDLMIMPLLCIVYGLNFLDKTTLSLASITGLPRAIGLRGDEYAWLGSVFYIGYLGFEFVAMRLLQRFPLSKYSGVCVVAWGVVLACSAAATDFAGAATVRLLLGIFEASVSPGWTLFTSQWYRQEEQGIRTAWWVSFNGWAQIFGGLVAYGFAHGSREHHWDIAPWKAIYIFMGVLTVVVGIIFLVLVPDNQLNAWWLTKEERIFAVERVRGNQQGIGNKHFKWYQLKEALLDPMFWAFFLLAIVADIPAGGLSTFFSQLIVAWGKTPEQSLLYGSIGGVFQIVSILSWAYLTKFLGNRLLWSAAFVLLSTMGAILLVAPPLSDTSARLVGFYFSECFVVGLVAVASLISSNIAGYTKKTFFAGSFFISYCVGNIIGPQTFRPSDAPYYRSAEIVIIVCLGVSMLDLIFIHWWYARENRRKERLRGAPGYRKLPNQEFMDLTDRENPELVYVL